MIIEGNNLLIYVGGSPVAGATSCDIEVSADMEEYANPNEEKWKCFKPGRKEWRITVPYLVTDVADLIKIGTSVTISVAVRNAASALTGTALIQQAAMNGKRGGIVTGSFIFRGTGPLA